ncbi:MAG: rhomboid family intramembrane serine protease [Rhodoferax sp.]|nr:rhomboid family intramembrane serine protease [Rhodoferax sp.]
MHESPWRAPVTLVLLSTNIAVFALTLWFGAGLWHNSNSVQLAWGANFGPATQDGQWWRLATAMFLHFGILHLGLNMWALWDVGRLVERLYGRLRFSALYLGAGVAGNLLSLVVQGNRAVSGGASGAIFGLYGALLVFLWRERKHVDRREFRWLFGAATVFTLFTLIMGQVVPGIDNAAHIGGLVTGALLGRVLARPWAHASPRTHGGRWIAGAALLLAVTVLVTHIPAPTYRMGEELRARQAIRAFMLEDRRIRKRWDDILDSGRKNPVTFEQLAGRIDTNVTADYQESFEQLSALSLDVGAPSAQTLETLRNYAALRGEASRQLAEGLRARDPEKIRQALETARRAPVLANSARPPASAASAHGK